MIQDVGQLKKDAVRVVKDAREHAQAHVAATRDFVGEALGSAQSRVMANPLYILGAGFLLGLWVGSHLFGRRS